ncbi:3037_t:CDS:2 [Diversispora eburnea]|uniref:3037_t:CDS:1 n=1 Tax=Diversispora eburnea TaxID=1213867 RepID=A0A9N8UYB4_9GLOM|nr:3037_t:CDS:2 [Diversispora eburnea]
MPSISHHFFELNSPKFKSNDKSLQNINDINDINIFPCNLPESKNLSDYHSHRHYPSISSTSSSSSSSTSSSTLTMTLKSSTTNTTSSVSSSTTKLERNKKRGIPSIMKYPDFPVKAQCPKCSKFITTKIYHKNGKCVYVLAMGLFSLTVVLFWVPFFVDSCKDITHICPNCDTRLGTRHRL